MLTEVEEPELLKALLSVCRKLRALHGNRLSGIGLAAGQDEFLLALKPDGALDVGTVADKLAIRPSTVSKMVDRMTAAGLVSRARNSKDGRSTLISLSPKGVAKRAEARSVQSMIRTDLAVVNDDEVVLSHLATLDTLLRSQLEQRRRRSDSTTPV